MGIAVKIFAMHSPSVDVRKIDRIMVMTRTQKIAVPINTMSTVLDVKIYIQACKGLSTRRHDLHLLINRWLLTPTGWVQDHSKALPNDCKIKKIIAHSRMAMFELCLKMPRLEGTHG